MGTPNEGINGTLATGLIAHWDFDSGNLLDKSGNGRNLICINAQVLATDKDGNLNNAVNLYNTSYYKTNDTNNPLNGLSNWTISIWINIKAYVNNEGYLSLKQSTGARYNMYCDGLTAYQIRFHSDTLIRFDRAFGWHNIIIEFNGTSISAYFDNVLKGSDVATIINEVGNNLIFGKRVEFLTSRIPNTDYDEIRIFNRLLTNNEKTEIYTMGVNYYPPITKCDTPTFSKSSGSYPQEPFSVTISTTTADADIYYTTDGSDTDETKTLYTEAVTINKTTTLKAIAVKEGFDNSDIASVQYDLSDTSFVKTKHNIRVLERDLTFVAEIDTYTSLTFQRNMYNAGRFTLMLNYYTTNALELTMNRLIMLDNNPYKVGIIKGVKYIQDGNNETLEVTGFELKGIFKQRVTIPDAGQSHQKFSTTNFETILKGLVQKQCVDNTSMKFDRLEVVANTNKGFEFGFETRYKKLDEEIEKISRNAEIGYQVYLDFETKKWKFDIIRSNVVVDESAFLPIFSAEYDNMERQEFETDTSESKNYAIVAGQGEGADRTIKIVHSETTTDIDLSVMFADARDINTDAELRERGTLKLAEAAATYSFDCDIIDDAPFVYEIDWDLGDMVQIVSKKMGVKITKLVEEVTEFYQVGSDRKINAVFGKATPGIRKYIDTTNDVGID